MSGWGWAGSVAEFLSVTPEQWLKALDAHHRDLIGTGTSASQTEAWKVEHSVMFDALRECVKASSDVQQWSVIFEYELPLEGGRRPDVVVLAGRTLIVLEFKSTPVPGIAQIDQVMAYTRDLSDYHEASHDLKAATILVLPNLGEKALKTKDVAVTGPAGLSRYLMDLSSDGSVDLQAWLDASYTPLPTLVAAARRIFEDEPLPHVKTALSAGIPETIELINGLIDKVESDGGRIMVFVTGVPGAGKTLVGLRLVYERSETSGQATFLSGNGPLVQVLQDALKSRVFVRDLHAFIRTYGTGDKVPKENILVFDEAQRAWDSEFMEFKKGVAISEPSLLVRAGERVPDWSALVGLVGEGQEIHSGEEGGMPQWNQALADSSTNDWRVYCPPKIEDEFSGQSVETFDSLDLTSTLRSRRASSLHDWVRHLLQGNTNFAARLAARIQDQDVYPMYVSRDLDQIRNYAIDRYAGEPDKRYGLLASSHAKNLKRFGVDNSFMATSRMNVAKWFNASPDDPKSGCNMTQPITEFQCQGLELDLPIVCWGDDFRWENEVWELKAVRRKYPLEDPEQILLNTYRVLLTRGRDGFVIYVPLPAELDATERALLAAGVRPLPETLEAATADFA